MAAPARTRIARTLVARTLAALTIAGLALGCGGAARSTTGEPDAARATHTPSLPRVVPFDYVGQSWMRVPARIGDGAETRMMIDTGMGVTLLTPEACARARCVREGTWTGHRMSGQAVTLSLARVSSLTVAGHRVENAQVAVFDSDDIIHRDLGVDGIAGLDVFRDQPVTFDHPAMKVVLESPDSLAARRKAGATAAVRVRHEGPSTDVFLPLALGPGLVAEMEVDSGSLHMILDDRFMPALGIDPDSPAIERKDGRDETGQPYVRRYAKLPRAAHVAAASRVEVPRDATVMFQRIIHDGLLGQQFLMRYVVTFDLPRQAMIFSAPPARESSEPLSPPRRSP